MLQIYKGVETAESEREREREHNQKTAEIT